MANLPFVAFYTSKWASACSRLSATERGVFITLICEMYESMAPLEFEPKRLAMLCGTTPATLKKAVEELTKDERRIVLKEGFLWSIRVEKEIKRAQKLSENQSRNSHKRWEKVNKNNEASIPSDIPRQSHLEPDKDIEEEKKSTNVLSQKNLAEKNALHGFEEFWNAYAHKKARPKCEAIWKSKKLADISEQVISGAKRYASSRGGEAKYWKHPQGWLTDGRWTDEQDSDQTGPPHRSQPNLQPIKNQSDAIQEALRKIHEQPSKPLQHGNTEQGGSLVIDATVEEPRRLNRN